MAWAPLRDRYHDHKWCLKEHSSLWDGCQLFLGGKGAGTKARDSSPYGNHGALDDGSQWGRVPFLQRNGWTFDGSQKLTLPDGFSLSAGLSFAAWFRVTNFVDRRTIFHQRVGDYELSIGCRDNELRASLYDWGAPGWSWGVSTAFTDTANYHHVSVSATTTEGAMWLNGIAAAGSNTYAANTTSAVGGRVGVLELDGSNYQYYLLGTVADVIVLSGARQITYTRRPDLDGNIRSTTPMMPPMSGGAAANAMPMAIHQYTMAGGL